MPGEALSSERQPFGVGIVGGPTAVIDIGGLRIVTDPTFDEPQEYEYLTKVRGPALTADQLGPADIVLLSHDQHLDNFDVSGRAYALTAGTVVTGPLTARRIGSSATGLDTWQSLTVNCPAGGSLTIEAVPAVHGPADAPAGSDGHINAEVTGFILSGRSLPTVYVSGDNASINAVASIAQRHTVDIAILFVGAARVAAKFGGRPLSLTSERASDAAALLGSRYVVPVHCDGWQHFTEGPDQILKAFDDCGLAARLVSPELGTWLPVPGPSEIA